MTDLSAFDVLIGTWTTEATHPSLPGTVVPGTTTYSWLEGNAYIIQRSHNDHDSFPDAIAIIGPPEHGDNLLLEYFDSRGVRRTYTIDLTEGVLRIHRDEPGFAQRCTARLADDAFHAVWQLARTPGDWHDDVEVTYRRVLETP